MRERCEGSFLSGSVVPLPTPYRLGVVDCDAFVGLVERQVEAGSSGVVVCGTTGEPSALSIEERSDLIRLATRAAGGRIRVVAATGTAEVRETLALTAVAEEAGADAALIVTPYYSRPPQRGLLEYLAAVASSTTLPVLVYHIPGRAAVSLDVATLEALVGRCPNVVGVKHASTDLAFVDRVLKALGPQFLVFAGLEELSFPMLAVGACGVMNAAANVAPTAVRALCTAVAEGDLFAARHLHQRLGELNQAIFWDVNPIPLKYLLWRMGVLPSAEVRPPLSQPDVDLARRLDSLLDRAGPRIAEAPAGAPLFGVGRE